MDIFPENGHGACKPQFPARKDHPFKPVGIEEPSLARPIPTNKFYGNFLVGSRLEPTWLHPYSVWWSKSSPGFGLSVAHTEPGQRVFGPDPSQNPAQYYYNPVRIQSICFSAKEMEENTTDMSIDDPQHMSATLYFKSKANPRRQYIRFPLVQGSAFVTAEYHGISPIFASGVRFRSFQQNAVSNRRSRSTIVLEDGHTWLLYTFSESRDDQPLCLRFASNERIEGDRVFWGIIQLIKIPRHCEQASFQRLTDACAGRWATAATLNAQSLSDSVARYTIRFHTHPNSYSSQLLMYALPHHVQSFAHDSRVNKYSNFQMQSTTKGSMTAIVGDEWCFEESNLPCYIGFDPVADHGLSGEARNLLRRVVLQEAGGDPQAESNLNSMYFSGKALDKFACLCWVIAAVLGDQELAQSTLLKLKRAFARFEQNAQQFPLVYDELWGGVVARGLYDNGDWMQDFGNGCYNDHHFHYGYFIHTAAIIAKLDLLLGNGGGWYNENRGYVDTLIRDIACANEQDQFFSLSRSFDWFHGHSWAKGIFESQDSKDEESTSEDAYCSYALKLWGQVSGNKRLEHRANLMLAIQRRVFCNYFLLEDDNPNQPAQIIGNKVAGILFENKVDHTTYFGHELRYIQGIHMIPVSPISRYIRSQKFIREEWERFFANDDNTGNDGWKGILYSNLSIIDPGRAKDFFASEAFNPAWIDGGTTRAWSLAMCL
ncbi:Probable endo-1,3(4)-beta-glucanase ARB_01444 {ECO:0000305} Short=Endo-1,3-beta-glucanase {ECO:0000250/UniProtKB:Q5AIR7}; Short=Endo-1,4-beta-glucanase {ECO:0000250/UniProtKB:Q5AIR7}; {ECO:0000250/UniProtKB:Q5AIR7}; AltName: Full=Laminarinase {ECO:0000250/UniProtKB:Q5AIR7}; Flags: Precursor [Serendipita indica DSM 11827]|nr:Probable endo-1,3(4)-beta-glucanase ARB_01444 {ECO:0000305} Short=Endo-1,3-beta-glucanase {ECO:0000250/UniProtKB:Q5AIR7}; Short=Endo-1,4-beta-glucanase {ECO:0000250/UniProtKB:Q5AIR7}; {ECO:0000250/UniProtKB:Q5AIR7}; AltName: Full=Laminarinase {ECO:0000250/UniProtKB:Q5AIR7}; Flags: Precursor [Serendipita indica DSM 11827]